MGNPKINIEFFIQNSAVERSEDLINLTQRLPKEFTIQKFGSSDRISELHDYKGKKNDAYKNFLSLNPNGPLTLRLAKFTLNYFGEESLGPHHNSISLFARAQKFESRVSAIDIAWEHFIPDGKAFYQSFTGYMAKASDPRYGQKDAEDVNRFNILVNYPIISVATGEYAGEAGHNGYPLDHLDLLPGLMWRIGMGEHHFEKYNISPEEISKVCVSTEETTAANGDKLWKFQSREDPLDWRDSYNRQLKLDRPDVFFDIAPLRERFAAPVDIKDSGLGDELDKLFKRALIELYPESATRGIKV